MRSALPRALNVFRDKKPLLATFSAVLLVFGVILIGTYAYTSFYGFNVVFRHGGSVWVTVGPDDRRLSPAMRLALQDSPPAAEAGQLEWRQVDEGFEVAEVPVLANNLEIDRLLLARIDPNHFRFVVRNAPSGNKELGDWMKDLGATLVINGSYFLPDGTPATPFLSSGIQSGPQQYAGRHGAFVASTKFVGIRDLHDTDWQAAFRGAQDAMVSYPLLVAPDGSSRVTADRRWLANRSFVGQDSSGRIILGTTADAFFSLDRLAAFLQKAPLGFTIALNLDGGPVACQGIALKGYRRDFCGKWELATTGNDLKLLTWVFGTRRAAMPIVLAVMPK